MKFRLGDLGRLRLTSLAVALNAIIRHYEPEVVNAATFADGNVRQALLDAKGLVQRSLQLLAV